MTDLQDLRARLRDERGHEPVAATGGVKVPFGIVAAVAVALGFVVVMFTPKIYSVQRTATLPTFKEAKERVENPAGSAMMAPVAAPKDDPARYAGKSFEEIGKLADGVCFQRAHALVPHWSKTPRLTTKELSDFADTESIKHFDILLHCLITEAPQRYCSRSQRGMIKSEIITYFRGIEYANASIKNVTKQIREGQKTAPADLQRNLDADPGFRKLSSLTFAPDPKVMSGIEGLMHAGYLTVSERSDIGSSVPPAIRDRFARVVGNKLPCPDPPWWAVWR